MANFVVIFVPFLLLIVPNQLMAEETEEHPHKTEETWNYEEPEEWGGKCQKGDRQSPIDIHKQWFIDYKIPAITFANYEKNGTVTMKNNGHTVIVSGFDTWEKQPNIADGGLGSKYMLSQFHFHWSQNENGSEHTVDGEHYDAEIHLVHVKEGLSLSEALALSDGVAVLGIFFKSAYVGSALLALQNGLSQVTNKDDSVTIEHYEPNDLLPTASEVFFRYNGSLTTPDCNEAVIWTVFAVPKSISREQIQLLRAINGHDGKPISSNIRPVQKFSRKVQKFGYNKVSILP
ncbi:hypothetical protein niasHT_019549 [Heterodera trifolii]|uniref:Carbonic anhydrase n=1 Tax=Heterodera trifolii TaxID=157864 RepID=A0ABD2KW45_9BILA